MKTILFLFVFLIGSAFSDHEFWLEVQKFHVAPGEQIKVNFKVGENFIGEGWNLKKDRLQRLEHHRSGTVNDITEHVVEGAEGHATMAVAEAGTHMLVMQSNDSFIEMEADEFNEYLQHDGLDETYAQREKNNELTKKGKERYARYTKLLFQVGGKVDDTYKKVAGLPMEIIPQQNPYALNVGDPVSFKIVFKGKPLFGAKVRVWNRYQNRTTVQNIYTQQDGVIETHISNPGAWMVSVVKMTPSQDPKVDWESYWGTLVFGIQK